MKVDRLTLARLREVLRYEPETGCFYWRVSRGTMSAGSRAGNIRPDGYSYIAIDRVLYRTSRLAWLYVNGEWPVGEVDHENGNTGEDRFGNLRDASHSQNMANRKLNKNNVTGFKGVCPHGRKFRAYINKDHKRLNLGTFETPQQAHARYVEASKAMFGEFARAA